MRENLHDNQNDAGPAFGLLADVKKACGTSAEMVLADSGYCNDADLHAIESHGAQSLVSTDRGEKVSGNAVADELVPGPDPHEFRCLTDKVIPIMSKHGDGSSTLEFNGRFCNGCPLKEFCTLRKTFKAPPVDRHERRRENRNRVKSEDGRLTYRQKKAVVEPGFGNIKNKGIKI